MWTVGAYAAAAGFAFVVRTPLGGNIVRLACAMLQRVRPESLTIVAPNTGATEVRFHYTDLYRVSTGDACITYAPGGWIDVHVRRPGTITLTIGLSPSGLLGGGTPCQ